MKKDIHPKINTDCKVTCACGNTFTTISTLPTIHVDICSACHPLFTGTQKLVDIEGRIDKFHRFTFEIKAKKAKAVVVKEAKNVSLKDMLKQLKDEETKE